MKKYPIFLFLFSSIPFLAAQQPAAVRQRMEASVSRQTASARGMQISVDRQKAAVQRQTRGSMEAFFGQTGSAIFGFPPPPECDPLPPPEIDWLIQTASRREGVDPYLIRDVMNRESAFRPCAVSPKGAMGLMQLMPSTAGDLGVSNPLDPEQNVNAGTQYLKRLMLRYGGDLALTLGAYNAGPARVDSYMAVPEIPETVDYVRSLLAVFTSRTPGIAADETSWISKR